MVQDCTWGVSLWYRTAHEKLVYGTGLHMAGELVYGTGVHIGS